MNIRDIYLRLARRQQGRVRHDPGESVIQSPKGDSGHAITDLFERLVAEAVKYGVDDDRIAAALGQATQAAANVLAERLRADAPRMLREHREFRRGFEERLQQRWGPALDLYECVRVCCLEAGEDFVERNSQQTNGADPKLAALTLLHARACLVASEVQSLLRSGHAAGAQARWRTLHELAVIAFVLGDQDRDISERFLQHRQVERHKDALHYQEYCEALGYPPFTDEEMAEIRQQRDEVVVRYGTNPTNTTGAGQPHCCQLASGRTSGRSKSLQGCNISDPGFVCRATASTVAPRAPSTSATSTGGAQLCWLGPSNAGLADSRQWHPYFAVSGNGRLAGPRRIQRATSARLADRQGHIEPA